MSPLTCVNLGIRSSLLLIHVNSFIDLNRMNPRTKMDNAKQAIESMIFFSSSFYKKFCPILHHKEALICWLQKFFLSCTIINGELHQKMLKSSDKNTKMWCSLRRIFCNQEISATSQVAQQYWADTARYHPMLMSTGNYRCRYRPLWLCYWG